MGRALVERRPGVRRLRHATGRHRDRLARPGTRGGRAAARSREEGSVMAGGSGTIDATAVARHATGLVRHIEWSTTADRRRLLAETESLGTHRLGRHAAGTLSGAPAR